MATATRILVLFFFGFIFHLSASAQGGATMNAPIDPELGIVVEYPPVDTLEILQRTTVKSDTILTYMLDWHAQMNERAGTFPGYRVQIFFSSGQGARERAQAAKTNFLTLFPEHKAYITYSAPDFKVRVGDFRSKSDALSLKKKLVGQYNDSFIVPEQINYPKL